MANRRKVIVHIATSADGFIARRDGDLGWLTSRPKRKGFYGTGEFMRPTPLRVRRGIRISRGYGAVEIRATGFVGLFPGKADRWDRENAWEKPETSCWFVSGAVPCRILEILLIPSIRSTKEVRLDAAKKTEPARTAVSR
jgi:hypothetical protein